MTKAGLLIPPSALSVLGFVNFWIFLFCGKCFLFCHSITSLVSASSNFWWVQRCLHFTALLEGWPESSSSTSSSSTKPASNSGMEKTKLTVESSKKRRVEVTLVIDSYYTSNDPDQDSN